MKPSLYHLEEQCLSPEVDPHAQLIVRTLRDHGFSAYIVGGWVRDFLLGVEAKDCDISTNARPEEIKALFPSCILIGRRFRLAHVRFKKKIFEVATFRSGDSNDSSLIIQDNNYGTEEEDVLRRDFTINGLLYDDLDNIVIDYVGGYLDAKNGILRTIGDPEVRFSQDPVRMLRLLKFEARFSLSVDPKTRDALRACKDAITNSSQARILEEILRMLESRSARPFFENLAKHGLLPRLLPALPENLHAYIFQFLGIADREEKRSDLARPLLMSCVVYPYFVFAIEKAAQKQVLNLQEVSSLANQAIDELFAPFFQIPRKMKRSIRYILTAQCRFTPLRERAGKKFRIPFDEDLLYALKFFALRTHLQPELKKTYQVVSEVAKKVSSRPPKPTRPRRARSR
ncbi:MAG: polynucleotide adenylyltransferase PcnB [Chlamydiota bacterium]